MSNKMESRCKFWLPKKNRFCANAPLNQSLFCGNHNPRPDDQRVPCPLDPSHSVLQENLEGHLKKCPLLKQVQNLSLQPFYQKGFNRGKDGDEEEEEEVERPTLYNYSSPGGCTSSDMKRNGVHRLTVPQFFELIGKIESIHCSICSDIRDSYKIPEACNIWINRKLDRKLPFQEKHVLQQASILGNLEEFGVLENPFRDGVDSRIMENDGCSRSCSCNIRVPAVVEFGAGRGYLTQMLADCYGISRVFLVERKSYKLKADRSLRQNESLILERLKIDIEDLNLNAVESLRGVPFLAIGKHLCGPATDLTLRCCLLDQNLDEAVPSHGNCCLRGLAVATCCHHLCQWKYYINKGYLTNLGITKDEFNAISWFTSWAVDADHSANLSDMVDRRSFLHSINEKRECNSSASKVEEILKDFEVAERAALGFMCKDIIDMGRLMWIKEQGLETQLVKYVPGSVSPENHLLVAKRTNPL